MKLEQARKEYLDWKALSAKRAAVSYRLWLVYFQNLNGDREVSDYGIQDLVKYRNWLEDNYSAYSVMYGMVVLHNFFKFWRLNGVPCLAPELVKVGKAQVNSHRAVTEKEFHRIVGCMDEPTFIALRDRLIVSMLWDTGIRISELVDLNIEQIDTGRRTTVIATKKTASKRVIMWSESTHKLLLKYLPLRSVITMSSPLFICHSYNTAKFSKRLTSRSIERHLRYYVKKAGIEDKVTPHSFRHGWAHHRLDQRASLPFIQRGLGHRNPMSTHVYLQYNDKEFEAQAESYL